MVTFVQESRSPQSNCCVSSQAQMLTIEKPRYESRCVSSQVAFILIQVFVEAYTSTAGLATELFC